MNQLLIGLALAAGPVPINEVAAAYIAETGATDVACSQTPAQTICYGLDGSGAVISATWVDGTFTPLGGGVEATTTSFDDGIWTVGTHITPGTYSVVAIDDSCTWWRFSNLAENSTVAIDSVEEGATEVVEILPSDVAFYSHDCGTWTAV